MSDTETILKDFYDKAYAAGVAAERERCARVCERVSIPYENTSSEAAAAIRKGE
jgi:predicted hydrolase (HD superfamily)